MANGSQNMVSDKARQAFYLQAPHEAGGHTDQYGNLLHNRGVDAASDSWNIKRFDGTAVVRVYWETGEIDGIGAHSITLPNGYEGEFHAIRGTVGIWMGISSGNTNHGLYSDVKGDWMIYANSSGSVQVNGNAATATIWQHARTFTVGATGKSVNGSADVSWSMNEIMGASDSSKFYRGDKTWSNTIVGAFTASSSGSNRANINMITVADQPNDFYLGNNNASKWSITSRASNESYNLYVYSTGSGVSYATGWEYSTGKFMMLHGASLTGGSLIIDQPATARRNGIIGTYDYTKAAAIWAMGSSYQIAADGSGLGSLYGAAYVYQGQGGTGGKTLAGGHQFVWAENGGIDVALGGNGVWIKKNGGIYWDPYVESASDASDVTSIYQIASGVAGGTELRINQQNDAADCINLCTNSYIYLNSKRAFTISDSWLRINEDKGFSSGIYTGSSLIRSDYRLEVGSGGAQFYATNGGMAYVQYDFTAGRYLYCAYVNESCGAETPNDGAYWIYSNSDGWLRKSSRANIVAKLDLEHKWVRLAGDTMTGLLTVTSGSSLVGIKVGSNYINAIGDHLIIQNCTELRFGTSAWDYDQWAGMRYDNANKHLYLGVAASPMTRNSEQTGYLTLTGIKEVYMQNGGTAWRGIRGLVGDNDYWRVGGAATSSNAGYMEIATADDGNEPIYVRQYTGVFSSIKRTLTLLDANGYSYFPSYINIGGHENNASSPPSILGFNGSDTFVRSYQTQYIRAGYLGTWSSSPNNSHPGYGARIFYSWNIGQAFNDSAGYSNGITIGSHPSDTAYGFQIVQNMWNDQTYTRRYNGGWQGWRTLMNCEDAQTVTNYKVFTSTGSNRATLYLRSAADVPNDFWFGSNNSDKWSITCRGSGESHFLGFYSATNGAWRMRLYHNGNNYCDGEWHVSGWVRFANWTGLYSPNNGAHFYPNNSTSYGAWQMQGSRNGYYGLVVGPGTQFIHLMDNGNDKGLYEQDQRWILYYNRSNGRVSIRDSYSAGWDTTNNGSFYNTGSMYVNSTLTASNIITLSTSTYGDGRCQIRITSNRTFGLHLGSGGVNRGIYDFTNNHWLVYYDDWNTSLQARDGWRVCMQTDGNLVVYKGTTAYWSSKGGRLRSDYT